MFVNPDLYGVKFTAKLVKHNLESNNYMTFDYYCIILMNIYLDLDNE